MYFAQRLNHTLAIGLAFAALAVVASDASAKPLYPAPVAGDTSGSTNLISTSTLDLPASQETAIMKRGRADVQAMKKRTDCKQGRLAISEDYNNGHFSEYLSAKLNDYGGYGITTTDPNEALTVTYDDSETGYQSLFINGYTKYPYIAAVPGPVSPSSNLGAGCSSHVLLTPGDLISSSSPPQTISTSLTDYTRIPAKGESGIFHVAPTGENRPNYHDVSPQWVNPNGKYSSQEFFIATTIDDQYALGVTGDFTALSTQWLGIRRVRLLIEVENK